LNVLLDTHALLWWQAGGRRLSQAAATAIDRAELIHLSPVTFWEIATLRRFGRVELDRELGVWVHDLLRQPRIAIAALTPEAATWAGDLGADFPGDLIDRLLYATGRDIRVPMVSKDERLRDYSGDVEFIW
jgi:PIN domain nuclease of toxin-antitoxin system